MDFDQQIEILLRSPNPASLEWARDPEFFSPFLKRSQAVVNSDPKAGETYARVACKVAPTNCDRVQALGLLGQVDSATGKPDLAMSWLRAAAIFGEDCAACRPDLRRRRAYVRIDQERYGEALLDAESCIEDYLKLGGPGHDLDGNGLAKAHMCRGYVHFYADRPEAAGKDFGQCLDLTDPTVSPALYRVTIFNLAAALFQTGRRSDLKRAEGYLKQARRLFANTRGPSQERAKIEWLAAMVYRELGKARPSRVRKMLGRARRDLIFLGLVQEGAAISADMMRAAYPDRNRIREAIAGLERDYAHFKVAVPGVIVAALHHVKTAVGGRGFVSAKTLQAAVEGLREACGQKMLACLVTWRPLH